MSMLILVHGAGTGGWLWEAVASELERRGHDVQTPTLSGVGERVAEGGPHTSLATHVAEIRHLVQIGSAKPVLVGFSYGGLVIGGVAECVPHRIAALIYLDAFVPENGRSMFDYLPLEVRAGMEEAAAKVGDGWRMPPIPVERLGGLGPLGARTDPDVVRQALAKRGPQPIGTYREAAKVSNLAARQVPCAYIACATHSVDDPMALIAARVRAGGMPIVEFNSGHFPMLTKPLELVDTMEATIKSLVP